MIITTIDVENPAVSQPFGDPNFAMLSNLLDFHLTPYPDGFEIAGEGFELTIDGAVQSIDVLTGAYARKAIKSSAELQFGFETDVPGIHADWLIESADGGAVTGWDGQPLGSENNHMHSSNSSQPATAIFSASQTRMPNWGARSMQSGESGCSCTTHTGIHESQTSLCTRTTSTLTARLQKPISR